MVAADFLEANFDKVFGHYQKLLHSDNYVTRRQSLKLLGELLLDRHNFSVSLINMPIALFLFSERARKTCKIAWVFLGKKILRCDIITGDDSLYFQPRQLEANDEHAEREVA